MCLISLGAPGLSTVSDPGSIYTLFSDVFMEKMGCEPGFTWPIDSAWMMCLSGFNAGKINHSRHVKQKEMKHRELGAYSIIGRTGGISQGFFWLQGHTTVVVMQRSGNCQDCTATNLATPEPPTTRELVELGCCSQCQCLC